MRVRDLEIALVLAREMKAAAARSADASLRLDQLQEVFGAESLDSAERARIQTALQMAGLEPQPSLLEADPEAPIRFAPSARAAAPAATAAGGGASAAPTESAAAEPDPAQTFPTVGQFARSKLGRSRRARRAERDDHGNGGGRIPPQPPAVPEGEHFYPEHDEPAHEGFPEDEAFLDEGHDLDGGEAYLAEHGADEDAHVAEPAADDEADRVEPDVEHVEHEPRHAGDIEPEVAGATEPEAAHHDPDFDQVAPEAAVPEAAGEEPDAAPVPTPTVVHQPVDPQELHDLFAARPGIEEPVAVAPESAPVASGQAVARVEDVLAILLPAVAIPVIITSFAGWSFGLPFVALSMIATGVLLGRRSAPGAADQRGLLATLRGSPATGLVLKTTAAVTALSVVASVLLATVGTSTTSKTADRPVSAVTKPRSTGAAVAPTTPSSKPATTPKKKRSHKPAAVKKKPPAPDPGTAGLVRVPPRKAGQTSGTGPNGTGSQGTTTPGTGTQQPSTGTGTQPSTGTGTQPGTGTGAQPGTQPSGGTGTAP